MKLFLWRFFHCYVALSFKKSSRNSVWLQGTLFSLVGTERHVTKSRLPGRIHRVQQQPSSCRVSLKRRSDNVKRNSCKCAPANSWGDLSWRPLQWTTLLHRKVAKQILFHIINDHKLRHLIFSCGSHADTWSLSWSMNVVPSLDCTPLVLA